MQKNTISNNKRANKRYKLDHCLELFVNDFKIDSQIKNISCGGVFCQTDKFVPLKTELNIKMDMSLFIDRKMVENVINCAAQVARIERVINQSEGKYNLGLSFSDLSVDDKAIILKFIKQRNQGEARELREMFRELKKMVEDLELLEEVHLKAANFRRVLNQAIDELESVASILDAEVDGLKHLN